MNNETMANTGWNVSETSLERIPSRIVWVLLICFLMWGGMFSGPYNWYKLYSGNPALIFLTLRAFLPIVAFFLCIFYLLQERVAFPFSRDPLGFLFLYGVVGVFTSFFLSVNRLDSIYWAAVYVGPLLLIWTIRQTGESKKLLRLIMYVNYVIFFFLTFALMPQAIQIFRGRAPLTAFYKVPLGFGDITKNGAGRYALVVVIFSAVRFLAGKKRSRFLWLALLVPSILLLAQTQSRTSLLGLAVVGAFYVLMRGLDWKYIFTVPVVGYVLYEAGFKLRAAGSLDALFDLTGRESTWGKALDLISRSPFLGWGFNSDRVMINLEHVHNSYIHALLQTGVVGLILFVLGFITTWDFVWRAHLIARVKRMEGEDKIVLMESILVVAFLFSRSFFESTAAFYGVDLLLLIPAMAYISDVFQEAVNEQNLVAVVA